MPPPPLKRARTATQPEDFQGLDEFGCERWSSEEEPSHTDTEFIASDDEIVDAVHEDPADSNSDDDDGLVAADLEGICESNIIGTRRRRRRTRRFVDDPAYLQEVAEIFKTDE